MKSRHQLGRIAAIVVLGLAAMPAWAIVSSDSNLDIAQVIGADVFYQHGYTGSRAIVANIEAGFVWNGHQTLTNVTTYLADPSITGQFDQHATWVGSAIAGQGGTTRDRGIAYGATLWSGAIATKWDSSNSFEGTNESFTTPYLEALVTGVNGQTADVVNSSWVDSSDTTGNDYVAVVIDSFAYKSGKTVVFAAGNSGAAANTVFSPGAGTNALVVGALSSDLSAPPYSSIASFSSRSPNDFFIPTTADGSTGNTLSGVRARIDITAPGTNLTLAHYGGGTGGNAFGGPTDACTASFNTGLAGTSFAAPITAAAAALVVDAGKALYPADARAIDGRVIKAVLMNSADKPSGWNNGQALVNGVVTTTQALDYTYGAGILDLASAYSQYTGGTADTPSLTGGTVLPIGWTYGHITHGEGTAHDDYLIDEPLKAGATLAATLDWYSDALTDANGMNPTYGSFDNLDLEVWLAPLGVPTTLVAQSDSLYDSAEQLDFLLPSDGTYLVRVVENNFVWNFNGDTGTDFGLAWAVPEPASLSLLALSALVGLKRTRKS